MRTLVVGDRVEVEWSHGESSSARAQSTASSILPLSETPPPCDLLGWERGTVKECVLRVEYQMQTVVFYRILYDSDGLEACTALGPCQPRPLWDS